MGYLAQGKPNAFFIRLTEEQTAEMMRLYHIGKRTNKKRVKKKLAKRVDNMVEVDRMNTKEMIQC